MADDEPTGYTTQPIMQDEVDEYVKNHQRDSHQPFSMLLQHMGAHRFVQLTGEEIPTQLRKQWPTLMGAQCSCWLVMWFSFLVIALRFTHGPTAAEPMVMAGTISVVDAVFALNSCRSWWPRLLSMASNIVLALVNMGEAALFIWLFWH